MKENEKNHFEGFEEKVKSMTAKEIVLAMVDGMINPVMKVNINTFGYVDNDGICYGCSATNMICKIANVNPSDVLKEFKSGEFINHGLSHHGDFLDAFEYALNELRSGSFSSYNFVATDLGISTIDKDDNYIIGFDNNNFDDPEQHKIWIDLANSL